MNEMKKCQDLLDDMIKSMTFDPFRPVEMTAESQFYNPYNFIHGANGGFMPYDSAHWQQNGRRTEVDGHNLYYKEDSLLRTHGVIKSEKSQKKGDKFERCVKKVKKKQGGEEPYNPWAVCHSSVGKAFIGDVLEELISKGGPGSGRRPMHGPDHEAYGTGGTTIDGKESVFYENPFKKIANAFKMKEIVARKDKEAEEKKKKEEAERKKPAEEKHKEEVRRLVSYMKSEEDMDKEKDLMKSLGFTTDEVNLIDFKEDNVELAKSIEKGGIMPQGRYSLDADQRPNQVIMKAYGSENLKDNHGEKHHKDNDKKVEKMVTEISEVENKDDTPKSRKLPDTALGKSLDHLIKGGKFDFDKDGKLDAHEKMHKKEEKKWPKVDKMIKEEEEEEETEKSLSLKDALNDLCKGATTDGSLRDRYQAGGNGDDDDDSEEQDGGAMDEDGEEPEVDAAEQEAIDEMKKERIAGTERGAEEESLKSFSLEDLAKACDSKSYKDLDQLSDEAHKKAKHIGKKGDKLHQNSKGM